MQLPDLANGLFEALAGFMIWQNVKRIRKDKQVRGTDWRTTFFFSAWGYWNMYYYPHLGQWLSFAGGCAITLGNSAWLFYAFKYRKN